MENRESLEAVPRCLDDSLFPIPFSRPYLFRLRLLPRAVLGGTHPWAPGMPDWHPGGGLTWSWITRKNFQKAAPSAPARPIRGESANEIELSDPAVSTATPCRAQASLARRRYAPTAPAVFDSHRVGRGLCDCPQIQLASIGRSTPSNVIPA